MGLPSTENPSRPILKDEPSHVEVKHVKLSHKCPPLTSELTIHPSGAVVGLNGVLIPDEYIVSLMESLDVTIQPNTVTLIFNLEKKEETPKEVVQAEVNKYVSAMPKKRKAIIYVRDAE